MVKPLESRRGQGRLAAMRFLYEWRLNPGASLDGAMEEQFKYLKVRAGIAEYASKLIKGVEAHQNQLDQVISENLTNWSVDRLAAVDHTVLKLGVYEMMYVEEVPTRVTINEMVEIAKNYGSGDSSSFCNGVLDAVRKVLAPGDEPQDSDLLEHLDHDEDSHSETIEE